MCGNFGLLAASESPNDEKLISELIKSMGALTELRGALGGGLGSINWTENGPVPSPVTSHRIRINPGKRDCLSDDLRNRYVAASNSWSCGSTQNSGSLGGSSKTVAIVAHTRYPTSSRSTENELHPHRWNDHGSAPDDCMWFSNNEFHEMPGDCDEEGGAVDDDAPPLPMVQAPKGVSVHRGIWLSHNGDFDEYDLFGRRVSYQLLGRWLSRVLYCPDKCVGDSPKAAGVIELLHVKGSWDLAVRLAYQKACCTGVGDAAAGDPQLNPDAPNTAPRPEWCVRIGRRFSALWREFLTSQTVAALADSVSTSECVGARHVPLDEPTLDVVLEDGSIEEGVASFAAPFAAPSFGAPFAPPFAAPFDTASTGRGFAQPLTSMSSRPQMQGPPMSSRPQTQGQPLRHKRPSVEELESSFVLVAQARCAEEWASDDPLVAAIAGEMQASFVAAAVSAFLHNDVFVAMTEFIAMAHGSFGLQVISATEPRAVAIAAKGQGMRLAVSPTARVAIWGSEGSAVEVPLGSGSRFVMRLDSVKGQVVHLKARSSSTGYAKGRMAQAQALNIGHAAAAAMADGNGGLPRPRGKFTVEWDSFLLRSFGCEHGKLFTGDELSSQFRPFVPPRLLTGGQYAGGGAGGGARSSGCLSAALGSGGLVENDAVLSDIRSIPFVLDLIISKWRDGVFSSQSLNRRSAAAFSEALFKAVTDTTKSPLSELGDGNKQDLHLLVVGIEVSLWASEQLAADVMEFIPGANAKAVSANQLVGGDKVYFSAADSKGGLSLLNLMRQNTVVLVVSQSGQTFPSLKATARLCSALGSRVFVLVGGREEGAAYTEMGAVVMDYHRTHLGGRDGSDHVFCNLSGPRPCEPSSVALVATHQTMTELLIFTRLAMSRLAGEGDGKGGEPTKSKDQRAGENLGRSHKPAEQQQKKKLSFSDRIAGSDPAKTANDGAVTAATSKMSKMSTLGIKLQAAVAQVIRRQKEVKEFREAVVTLTAPSLLNIRDIVGCDANGTLTPGGLRVDLALGRIDEYGQRKLSGKPNPSTGRVWRTLQGVWSAATNGATAGGGSDKDLKTPVNNFSAPPGPGERVHAELVTIGRRWGRHISEPWRVMFLCGIYVVVSVTFHCPVFRVLLNLSLMAARASVGSSSSSSSMLFDSSASISHRDVCWGGVGAYTFGLAASCPAVPLAVGTLVSCLDAAVYVLMPIYFARLLRWREERPLMHRLGKRTVIVADVPWVGLCVEAFASRLFSLAYGFAAPDVHSADPVDGLIHQFGHRSVRGLIVAVGRPDGRLFAFTKTESAVLLSTKQMSFVENLGENPEVVTLGSNPHFEASNVHAHVVLPSQARPKFMDELVYGQMMVQQKSLGEAENDDAGGAANGGERGSGGGAPSPNKLRSPQAAEQSPSHYLRLMKSALQGANDELQLQNNYGVFGMDALLDMSVDVTVDASSRGKKGRRGGGDNDPMSGSGRGTNCSRHGSNQGLDGSRTGPRPNARSNAAGMGGSRRGAAVAASVEQCSPGEMAVFQANLDAKTEKFLGKVLFDACFCLLMLLHIC